MAMYRTAGASAVGWRGSYPHSFFAGSSHAVRWYTVVHPVLCSEWKRPRARQLALGAARFPPPSPVPFVVVHGAGSFGHPQVRGARLKPNSSDSGRAFYLLDSNSTQLATNSTAATARAAIHDALRLASLPGQQSCTFGTRRYRPH